MIKYKHLSKNVSTDKFKLSKQDAFETINRRKLSFHKKEEL